MHFRDLSDAQVKLISGSEAKLQADRGIPVIDIRPPPEYEGSHIPNSVNIPLYRPITGIFQSCCFTQSSSLRRNSFCLEELADCDAQAV